ncbi:sugar/nucleoside kinase (ribokinase family) [Leucobacter exalbidus]|uniref:Sugar/nucleoside kinase (Ribokinase family) n=1 Tax=Leucobacter exalbidus TaxID=662960 RepID=A0A940PW71_9MICO|nr:PfkB family carbohydrate kinase [Leucobacter exalbidus]MBP1325331.1 sugar/nucleoside kinase (ribokinase family) [Leucobacter exalbidus]
MTGIADVHEGASPQQLDLFLTGPLFFDIIFTGLHADPQPGTETMADGMGSLPGGVANMAVAAARLGLRTGLAAGFGDDAYGQWNWELLQDREGIDLSRSQVLPGWHSPVTVSINRRDDRSMVTHTDEMPVSTSELVGATPPDARAYFVDLGDAAAYTEGETPWWAAAKQQGALVFADLGWDDSGEWDPHTLDRLDGCHSFLPNHVEAMAYTSTSSPEAALHALADRVPLAVVTLGAQGAMAIDQITGEEARVASVPVNMLDATGAGDVFAAAMITGTLNSWPLVDRLNFATLCAGLAVQNFGGSLGSPGWSDLAQWRAEVLQQTQHDDAAHALLQRFSFIDCLLKRDAPASRRARATIDFMH